MRILDCEIRPADEGWEVVEVFKRPPDHEDAGAEYESRSWWPGTFPQALRRVLDLSLKHVEAESLERAVWAVHELYDAIGEGIQPYRPEIDAEVARKRERFLARKKAFLKSARLHKRS